MEEEKYSRSFVIKVAAIVMSATAIVSILLSMLVLNSKFKSYYSDFSKIYSVDAIIRENYYQEYEDGDLVDNACRGMVAGLGDVYSGYYSDEDYEALMSSISSEYVGIGVSVSETEDGNLEVKEVSEGTPAAKAGIKPGDMIVYIDGISVSGVGADEALKILKSGSVGTNAVLTVTRGSSNMDITVTLDNIQEISVYYNIVENDIAYIRISSFRGKTGEEFAEALKKAETDGAKKLILDLRNNLGGEAAAAEAVADALLDECTIYYSMDKAGKKDMVYAKQGSVKMPMVVMINCKSASASELVCGALKENGRAYVVGENTYGKGLIQGIFSVEDRSVVKVTVAEYFTPDGNKVNGIGIAPDEKVSLNEGAVAGNIYLDNQLWAAINYLNKK